MRKIDKDELKTILEKHKMWLNGENGGERAALSGSNLSGSDLRWSELSGSKGLEYAKNLFYPIACPEKGEYTAFKKADEKIVELRIPADAKGPLLPGENAGPVRPLYSALQNWMGHQPGMRFAATATEVLSIASAKP